MYKVAIIDDEPIIVRGLSQTIPWDKYGCTLAGTAGSGEEGLALIRREQPDIVFSDIAMPGMNGLQMIAAMHTEFPRTKITILTGDRDFDYAQTAIRLGVCRFLLKPTNMDEIHEAIQFMTNELDRMGPAVQSAQPQQEAADATAAQSEDSAGSFIVRSALDYIEHHFTEKLTLAELADEMYVSQWHLSKLLNKHTQKSFSELINERRVQEAKRYLQDVSLRVSDVPELVGFADVAHFSRVFKKYTKMSAHEYRNTQIG